MKITQGWSGWRLSPIALPTLLVCISYGLLLLTLADVLMIWVLVLGYCACVVSVIALHPTNHPPLARTVNLLAVLSLFALFWFGLSIGVLDCMINLLATACALKLMQLRTKRDFHILICTCLFLIGCSFISALGIMAWLGLIGVLILLLLSATLYHSHPVSIPQSIRFVFLVLSQALPIAIMLFLLLPHLPPLWQMPTSQSSQTGLSESVTPGEIAELAKSSDLAFTATFTHSSHIPTTSQRYWRAIVMEDFNGKTWSVSEKRIHAEHQLKSMGKAPPLSSHLAPSATPALSYEIMVEPTHQKWLYSLALSSVDNRLNTSELETFFDYTIRAKTPITVKKVFYFHYQPSMVINNQISGFEKQLNLTVEKQQNPQTQAWAATLKAQFTSPKEIADALMRYFSEQSFRYTLQPNAMPLNPVDTFLFEEQAGFCAHYAGAMAYTLRAAGVPARLVTGYHGGEILNDTTIEVRQYDAHAWVEVLIDEQWYRYDPTGAVAPSRLLYNLEHALMTFGEQADTNFISVMGNAALFIQLQQWIRKVDYAWSKWVLGFDQNMQGDLLEQLLGKMTTLKMSLVLLGALGGIGLMLILYFVPFKRMQNQHPSPYHYYYLATLALVEKHTHTSRGHVTPRQYTQQVAALLPAEVRNALDEQHQLYSQVMYEGIAPSYTLNDKFKQLYRVVKRALRRAKKKP